jgi:hypothetical protein
MLAASSAVLLLVGIGTLGFGGGMVAAFSLFSASAALFLVALFTGRL